ncbi:MAG: YCF48-related protein [Desulfobacterales bacterium]|jgi:photosystem II stability/assembly factor-like uncharacterized protein|nr:YCF48-related protein [Desulfobacterales bacterium]
MFFFPQLLIAPFKRVWPFYAAVLLTAFWGAIPSAFAVMALLDLPAMKNDKAAESMLTDVVNTGTRLVAVGEHGVIVFSEDNGKSWKQATVPTSLTLTAVFFPVSQKGWAVGHDGVILHSNDGGQSWTQQLDGHGILKANASLSKTLVENKEAALSHATPEEREKFSKELEDSRRTLEKFQRALDDDICCEPFMDVWFKNEREGFVVGAYGQFCRTVDGGKTWQAWWDRTDNPDRLHLNGITQAAKGALFIAGEAGTLFRSPDGGEHWETLLSPYEGSFFGIVASPNDSYVIAFGINGNIAHSADLGESWRHILTGTGGALGGGAVCSDGRLMMVSYSGLMLIGSGDTAVFDQQKVGVGLIGVADARDGHAVIVGMRGAKQVPIADDKQGDK